MPSPNLLPAGRRTVNSRTNTGTARAAIPQPPPGFPRNQVDPYNPYLNTPRLEPLTDPYLITADTQRPAGGSNRSSGKSSIYQGPDKGAYQRLQGFGEDPNPNGLPIMPGDVERIENLQKDIRVVETVQSPGLIGTGIPNLANMSAEQKKKLLIPLFAAGAAGYYGYRYKDSAMWAAVAAVAAYIGVDMVMKMGSK